jgi:hypothetical protein
MTRDDVERQIRALKNEVAKLDSYRSLDGRKDSWRESVDQMREDLDRLEFLKSCLSDKTTSE